jgi:hypothetical protein
MRRDNPRRVCLVEVKQLFAERRQAEVVICLGRPFDFAAGLDRGLGLGERRSPMHMQPSRTIIFRPVGGSR